MIDRVALRRAYRPDEATVVGERLAQARLGAGQAGEAQAIARALVKAVRGHKAAGLWMKDHVEPDWQIVDPFGWAEWYTGRTLRAIPNPDLTKGPGVYVVYEPNAKSPHSRLGWYETAKSLHDPKKVFYRFPEGVPDDEIKVAVYKVPIP